MRILLSGNTAWSLYIFRGDLIRALLRQKIEVIVASPFDEHYSKLLAELGCKFISLKLDAKGINPFVDLKLYVQYIHIIKDCKIDFAFFYTIKSNIYGSFAARFCRIPHIAVVTGLGYTFINNNIISKISRILYKFSFKSPEEVWFLNEEDYVTFINKRLVKSSKARIIPGEGINLDYFSPVPAPEREKENSQTSFTFLLIARMLYDKGVKEFFEAACNLKKEFPQARFLLLGQADALNPSAISKETLLAWEQTGAIQWLGAVYDVRPQIAKADCVVLPSYREGIPRTLMEAAAMAKPLIATDVPGCNTVVENGVNGFLCEIKNSLSLAEKMKYMLQSSNEARNGMGNAGREKMQNEFDINIIIGIYFDALKKWRDSE